MGQNYAQPSGDVLVILLIGYTFFLAQLIAHGILKGISRHKMLAFFLCGEAVVNLGVSVWLAPEYGIKGVALGTAIPLIIANLFILPVYTCHILNINYFHYLWSAILKPLATPLLLICFLNTFAVAVYSYIDLIVFSIACALILGLMSLLLFLEKEHKQIILSKFSR